MGLGYVFGATPAAESASLRLQPFYFLEGALFEVAHSNLEMLTLSGYSSTLNFFRFFRGHFFFTPKIQLDWKWSLKFLNEKKIPQKNLKKFRGKEDHKRINGSKFEGATSIGAPSRKLNIYNRKLVDSAAGVAPSTYPMLISVRINCLPDPFSCGCRVRPWGILFVCYRSHGICIGS